MKFDCEKLSSRVRELRESMGLTYKDLERDFWRLYNYRISWQQFRRMEAEPIACCGVRIFTVVLMADYYGLTLDELVGVAKT